MKKVPAGGGMPLGVLRLEWKQKKL
ncbi:hypothetical protein DSM3645_06344 [Blastopirellula marina DSM 3645]|uniref:Uncharacterized protein n=1 Tax=Blastopirellula marina DSM 3645 TaxID=314230 RepID=A4A2P4_9BACT|nr:hypothetical protein DSM3645_06344 [Blastopirellula marina DSM 3645]